MLYMHILFMHMCGHLHMDLHVRVYAQVYAICIRSMQHVFKEGGVLHVRVYAQKDANMYQVFAIFIYGGRGVACARICTRVCKYVSRVCNMYLWREE